MTETPSGPTFNDPVWWLRLWESSLATAPKQLYQPILPGLLGITINQGNSSAPDTEMRILAGDSYGRQIGRLLDAVSALIDERPKGAVQQPAFAALADLKTRVDAAKVEAAKARVASIRDDLRHLKATDRDAYQSLRKQLKAILDD